MYSDCNAFAFVHLKLWLIDWSIESSHTGMKCKYAHLWYLADDCQLFTVARVRLLRSADTRTLTVHRTSSCFGDRTFAAVATRAWNSLPADLRKADCHTPGSVGRWRHLFRQSDYGALWTVLFLTAQCRNIRTYFRTYLGYKFPSKIWFRNEIHN